MTGSEIISAARVVSEGQVLEPGWLAIVGRTITEVGAGQPPRRADRDLPDATLIPGFVDMHVHGGGGADFADESADRIRVAVGFHRMHGTTTGMASLVSAAPDVLAEQVLRLRPLVDAGELAGIHLEGPWLAQTRCGAHDPAALRVPDPAEIDDLLSIADGTIGMVTLAPELDGGIDAVRRWADAGVVVALGHTDADYACTRESIAAGARVGTHLFNAMRPLHHREPGPVLALLADERVTVELIGDGIHVHPDLMSHVSAVAGTGRVALVTDAISATGAPDGAYRLGAVDIDVTEGVARVHATGALAGSTATMDALFQQAAQRFSRDDEVTADALVAAVEMCSRTPARALGLERIGDLRPGYAADVLAVDGRARLTAVLTA